MNKVVTINLRGVAYQLEETGYDALVAYLGTAGRRLAGNPDKDEILADIEQAIADKCRALVGAYKTVVLASEIQTIIADMGPVEDASGPPGESAEDPKPEAKPVEPAPPPSQPTGPKRLYRINQGAMLGGVCNGLAAYFEIDVTLVRLAFALMAFATCGVAVLAYVVMYFVVPVADMPAGSGPSTAQEFIKRAREGYYAGMKTFGDRQSRREWERKFKREMRGWKRSFRNTMHESRHQWDSNWNAYWSTHPTHEFSASVALPILWVLGWIWSIATCCAAISLLASGTLLGIALPHGLSVWVAIVILFFVYHIIASPMKAIRRSLMFGSHPGWRHGPHASMIFGDWVVSLVVLCVALWWLDHHSRSAREFLQQLPPAFHQAVHSVKAWWAAQ